VCGGKKNGEENLFEIGLKRTGELCGGVSKRSNGRKRRNGGIILGEIRNGWQNLMGERTENHPCLRIVNVWE